MVTDYAKMTIQELEKASVELAKKKEAIRVEQRKINAVIAKKTAKGGK